MYFLAWKSNRGQKCRLRCPSCRQPLARGPNLNLLLKEHVGVPCKSLQIEGSTTWDGLKADLERRSSVRGTGRQVSPSELFVLFTGCITQRIFSVLSSLSMMLNLISIRSWHILSVRPFPVPHFYIPIIVSSELPERLSSLLTEQRPERFHNPTSRYLTEVWIQFECKASHKTVVK